MGGERRKAGVGGWGEIAEGENNTKFFLSLHYK
jgi:hypothetical protein